MKKGIGYIVGILIGLILYFVVDAKMQERHSIGIIGGADGPTAIYIAGKIGTGDIILACAVVAAVIVLIIWLIRRKKK